MWTDRMWTGFGPESSWTNVEPASGLWDLMIPCTWLQLHPGSSRQPAAPGHFAAPTLSRSTAPPLLAGGQTDRSSIRNHRGQSSVSQLTTGLFSSFTKLINKCCCSVMFQNHPNLALHSGAPSDSSEGFVLPAYACCSAVASLRVGATWCLPGSSH